MSTMAGKFVWYELMTTDSTAAESFYKQVVGWDAEDSGMPGVSYTLLTAGGTRIGGLMTLPDEARKAGAEPGWRGYIAVDDVDAVARQVTGKGGSIHHGPEDIPGIGRFAVAADPQGAVFVLFKGEGEPRDRGPPLARRAISAGTSCTLRIWSPPSPSIPSCSDGRSPRQWIWGRWASTRRSRSAASKAAG